VRDEKYGDAFLAWRNFCHTLLEQDLADTAERFLRDLLIVSIARKGVHSHAADATELLLLQALSQVGRLDEVITECVQLLPHLTEEVDVLTARHLLTSALLSTGEIDRASAVAQEMPVEACSASMGPIELDLADAFLQRDRPRDAVIHLGRLLMIEARLCGAYSGNSLPVVVRIETAMGDKASEHADADWFAEYQRINDAFHRVFAKSQQTESSSPEVR
jgi:hypothetical protein